MPTTLAVFDVAALDQIHEGRVGRLVKQQLGRLAADCYDRPADKSPRKLVIELLLRPVIDQKGNLHKVKLEAQVRAKVPTYVSPEYDLAVADGARGFLFNPADPTDLDARSLLPEDDA